MEITEIRIKLMEDSEDRLRAFCSITVDDCFVVRDLKIIDGSSGPFVAMPSRKLTGHCQRCNHKNHLRAGYCNNCGVKLQNHDDGGYDSPQKLYADVAHPINSDCREMIQNAVIEEFEAELSRCDQPGYRSRYDDDFGYDDVESGSSIPSEDTSPRDSRRAGSRRGEGGPPRPHFDDRPKGKPAAADEEEDGFGAGIF